MLQVILRISRNYGVYDIESASCMAAKLTLLTPNSSYLVVLLFTGARFFGLSKRLRTLWLKAGQSW